ncbi:MAG: DNA repair protein RadC [Patescibacteria group bacterium]
MINCLQQYKIRTNNLFFGKGHKYILKIADLPIEDKPREKLLKFGPGVLNVSELLAILLNTGSKKEGVLALSERICQEYGTTALLNQKDPKKLHEELKIPLIKACQIVSCFELGRRFFEKDRGSLPILRNSQEVIVYLNDLKFYKKEYLRGLYLDSRNRLIHDEVISMGTLTANIIHPREVLRPAIEYSAVAFILAHNHPSGDPTPSEEDIEITQQIYEAAKILGLDFLDHIIVAEKGFASIPFKND